MEHRLNLHLVTRLSILGFLSLSIISSCTDEIPYEHISNDKITYKPILTSTWEHAHSRNSSEGTVQMSVLNADCQTFDIPLYLHALSVAREEEKTCIAYEPISRGTMTPSNDGQFDVSIYKEMGVIAFAYGANEDFPTYGDPNFINNDKVTMTGTTISSDRYWPIEDCNISFFAYAPYDKIEIDSPISGNPSFTYTTPSGNMEDIISQPDLLVSKRKDVSSSSRQRVQLEFCHALTAVTIIATPDFAKGEYSSCVIKSVAIRNVYDTGTLQWGIRADGNESNLYYDEDSKLFSWTQQAHMTSFEFSHVTKDNNGIALGNQNKDIPLNDDNDGLTLMMIPQTLPVGAILEVEFVDDLTGNTHFSKIPLNGQEWFAGHQVTYRLSTSDQFIVPVLTMSLNINNGEYNQDKPIVDQVSVNDYKYLEVFDYLGNWKFKDENGIETEQHKRSFQIDSYAQIATSGSSEPTKIPLDWTAEVQYMVDGKAIDENNIEIKDRWLNNLIRSGNGNLYYSNSFDVSPQRSKETSSNLNAPKMNALVGSKSKPYDLSTAGGDEARTTANCYIVNNPGYYTFPLVYGNAIKNDNDTETTAYISTATDKVLGSNGLRCLLNYDDAPIHSSYIYKDKLKNGDIINIHSACLLWSDSENMIDKNSVVLDSNKENLIFKIQDGFLGSGNALLGIIDNNQNIIWSWHIWVTDYMPYDKGEQKADVINITDKKLTTDNTGKSTNYVFMRYPIGWCKGKSIIYTRRDADIIIHQTKNGKDIQSQKIRIISSEHNDITPGNNTLYQFGRKDPMPGVVLNEAGESTQKSIYGNNKINIVYSKSMSLGEAISNPTTFSYQFGNVSWIIGNKMPNNLWAINAGYSNPETLTATLKTVYDPSPRGFKVPDNRIFYNSMSKNNISWIMEQDKVYMENFPDFAIPLSGIFDDKTGKFVHYINETDIGVYRVGRMWTSRCQGVTFSSHVCIKYYGDEKNHIEFHAVNCNHRTGMAILPMKDN